VQKALENTTELDLLSAHGRGHHVSACTLARGSRGGGPLQNDTGAGQSLSYICLSVFAEELYGGRAEQRPRAMRETHERRSRY